jgi:hypothetical protein
MVRYFSGLGMCLVAGYINGIAIHAHPDIWYVIVATVIGQLGISVVNWRD